MNEIKTHRLNIGDEEFEIRHHNKRLYKFMDWTSARASILRILLARLKETHNVETAYINISMANPMRRSRLGNFYIAMTATVSVGKEDLGTLEGLGLDSILVDDYVTYDEEEIVLREDVEVRYSLEQYSKELLLRKKSLIELMSDRTGTLCMAMGDLSGVDIIIGEMLSLEGWSKTRDNRLPARIKRLPKRMNLNSES